MLYRWLAVAVVGLHFAYLAYLAAGGFLAWRWPRTFAVHVTAAFWGVVIVATNAPGPLTVLQNMLRTTGGQQELETTFVNTYLRGVLFPADQEMMTRAVLALVIAASWFGLLRHRAHTSRRVAHQAVPPASS